MSNKNEKTVAQWIKEYGLQSVKRIKLPAKSKLKALGEHFHASSKFRMFAELCESDGLAVTPASKAIGAQMLIEDAARAQNVYYALLVLGALPSHPKSLYFTITGNLKKVCSDGRDASKYTKESFPTIPDELIALIQAQEERVIEERRKLAQERVESFRTAIAESDES